MCLLLSKLMLPDFVPDMLFFVGELWYFFGRCTPVDQIGHLAYNGCLLMEEVDHVAV